MGNYLYDDYEARLKYTNDEINDKTFYKKLISNFVSPKKVYLFIEIIFMTMRCTPYHAKFLQIFYNNLNILERDEYFTLIEKLSQDLHDKKSFNSSFNDFNNELIEKKSQIKDKSQFNYGLVKSREDALKFFFSYTNFYKNEFKKIKNQIDQITDEIKGYIITKDNQNIRNLVNEEIGGIITNYIGEISNNNAKDGKGIFIRKNKLNGNIISEYIGLFKNDQKNGFGILKDGNVQIEGIFNNNEIDGLAAIYYENKVEICEFNNGIKNGRSISFFKNGDIETTNYNKNELTDIYSFYNNKNKELFTGNKYDNGNLKGIKYYAQEGCVDVGLFNSENNLIDEGYNYRNYNGFYGIFNNGKYAASSLCYKNYSNGEIYRGACNEFGKINGDNNINLIYTDKEYKGDIYIGGLNCEKWDGKGEYYWGNGDYERIMENGWGFRVFNDEKEVMEGQIEGGFANGPGYFTYKGTKYIGIYKLNNERCLFISSNNKAYRCGIGHNPRFNEANATQYKTQVNN